MIISIVLFFIILGAGFVVGFILPLRPKTSEIEQRSLASFPEATKKSVINGDYFADIALWYSDTFPGREEMIQMDDAIKELYGFQSGPQLVGTSMVADAIPTKDSSSDNEVSEEETVSENEVAEDTSVSENEAETEPDDDIPYEEDEEPEDMGEDLVVEPPTSKRMEAEIKQYIQQNLYVKDGAAHSLYYFSQKACERYTGIIEHAAEELDGIANVYNILVPNSSGVVLSDEEINSLGGSNQADAVHYYYSRYTKATGIESVDVLRQHRDEYLFFRTDHHWTALGAYYVYRNFCKEKGFEPHELDYYTTVRFSPFLGSYYSSLKRSDMANNPDYVEAYIPKGTNDLIYYDKKGKAVDYDIIHDVSGWSQYTKYNCFIGGDQPMQKIVNPMLRKQRNSCLVIKESYGNCFVPFLVDHYRTVYVMDYRYCNKNVIAFIKEKGIDDLIIINNISIIGSGGVMSKLSNMLSE